MSSYLDPCVYRNTDYSGHVLKKKHEGVTDWRECSKLCSQNTQCHAWSLTLSTFHDQNNRNNCYLKKAQYKEGRKSQQGVISGEKICGRLFYSPIHNIGKRGYIISGEKREQGSVHFKNLKFHNEFHLNAQFKIFY